jgi:hypothetical protein
MARPKNPSLWITKNCKLCNCEYTRRKSKPTLYCSKKCSNSDPDIKQKIIESQKETFQAKYGGHPMLTDATKEKLKTSIQDKYGVDHYSQHDDHNKKVKQTLLSKYGVSNYNNIDQIKKTTKERYGVSNVGQLKESIDKRSATKLSNHYTFLTDYCKQNNIEFLCNANEYKGYHFANRYNFKCGKCNRAFETTVYNLQNIFCDYCSPEKITTVESQLYTFLQSILPKETIIHRNDRTVLVGKELDFYIPSKKIAFEINGLYWHSEMAGGINRKYHLKKTKSCMFHGLTLMHIFENEWLHKSEIVKSIIKTTLGINTTEKIHARKCIIQDVSEMEKNKFLNDNHLQGADKSSIKLGLYYNGELVSLMTFRKKSRFDKTSEWELMRFCNKLNTIISGGASKLFSHFLHQYNANNIVSYCDRRYFTGSIYSKLGFNFTGYTPENYYYITNKYKTLQHRMSFQKHKLKAILPVFDPDISEWDNMKNNGYDRIWDCGHGKWVYVKPC